LDGKIRWATWNKKKLEEHLFDGGIKWKF
jgi:hypothetical protein